MTNASSATDIRRQFYRALLANEIALPPDLSVHECADAVERGTLTMGQLTRSAPANTHAAPTRPAVREQSTAAQRYEAGRKIALRALGRAPGLVALDPRYLRGQGIARKLLKSPK